MKVKFAVFVSGYGRGAIKIIKDYKAGLIKPELKLILSTNPSSHCLKVAKENHIATEVIERKEEKNIFEDKLLRKLKFYEIDYIFLAGFKYILGDTLLKNYPNKILNIHPSLLPAFKGLNAIDQALSYGVKYTGITVHYVDKKVDSGKIIDQIPIEIEKNDDFKTIDRKIFKAGSMLTTKCINKIFK